MTTLSRASKNAGQPRLRSLLPAPDLRERWRTSFIEATPDDWTVEHEHVARVFGLSLHWPDILFASDRASFSLFGGRARLPFGPAQPVEQDGREHSD